MKKILWSAATTVATIASAASMRRVLTAVWPGKETPPLNPADRSISWTEAVGWAALSGLGAGMARMLSRRAAATGWKRAFGEEPPGVQTA